MSRSREELRHEIKTIQKLGVAVTPKLTASTKELREWLIAYEEYGQFGGEWDDEKVDAVQPHAFAALPCITLSDSISCVLGENKRLSPRQAFTITSRYSRLANKIGRRVKDAYVDVPHDLAVAKTILQEILNKTSHDYLDVIVVLRRMTGWGIGETYECLDRLAVENFIELRRAVRPYNVVKRF